ncbi:MEDS domain-containing protein [Sporosarcina cyprini]|uniref:MEDS domain-containing protein n=1 Tax=Sporosarcina cyprini TaxID=2910523 RepID=UPI001EDCB33C|nr:MEDS domain-containing protein [Sporosarcina cyprini]MCG3089427.1 MEDS domain-containing protein [Sporosarcina cyprini]
MGEMLRNAEKSKIQKLFEEKNAHVLYMYADNESYLQQVISFIKDGIAAGEIVFLVENERNYILIFQELRKSFSSEEMKYLHYVNSISFYLSSGSYYPPAIEEYFTNLVHPCVKNKLPFRSWAHVEWASLKGPSQLIEVFEKIVDQAVNEIHFSLICAYDRNRMLDDLHEVLLKTHPYILEDEELILSQEYSEEY